MCGASLKTGVKSRSSKQKTFKQRSEYGGLREISEHLKNSAWSKIKFCSINKSVQIQWLKLESLPKSDARSTASNIIQSLNAFDLFQRYTSTVSYSSSRDTWEKGV